jgi:hypothetical protein
VTPGWLPCGRDGVQWSPWRHVFPLLHSSTLTLQLKAHLEAWCGRHSSLVPVSGVNQVTLGSRLHLSLTLLAQYAASEFTEMGQVLPKSIIADVIKM